MTDTIAEIRARHEAASAPDAEMTEVNWRLTYGASAHNDRAALLPIAERCLAAEARVAELEAALKPFAALSPMLPNWTEGTLINVTVYHVGAPTTLKGAIKVRDLRRAAQSLKEDFPSTNELQTKARELYDKYMQEKSGKPSTDMGWKSLEREERDYWFKRGMETP